MIWVFLIGKGLLVLVFNLPASHKGLDRKKRNQ